MKSNNYFYLLIFFISFSNLIYSQSINGDGTRIKSKSSGDIYFIIDRKKCLISNNETYNNLFKDFNGIQTYSDIMFGTVTTGPKIKNAYLCKGTEAPVFLIINNVKRHIVSVEIFNSYYFDWNKIKFVEDKDLLKIKTSLPIECLSVNNLIPKEIIEHLKPCGTLDNK